MSSRTVFTLAVSGLLAVAGIASFASIGAAAPAHGVFYKGKLYYKVDGNNPAMDTGKEVCASVGKACIGYTVTGNNDICKIFHPNAKVKTSIHGSKNGYYCNGAPQTGLACSTTKDTCQVCPACNVNATCDTPIGTLYREMYVECAARTTVTRSRSRSSRSRRVITRRSSLSRRGQYGALPSGPVPDSRIGQRPGYKVCEYYQTTKVGDPVRATKKLVSCGVPGLGDQFCRTALNNLAAKALRCDEHGIVVCGLPCTTPGARNNWFCSADLNRPRGTMVKPLDFCPPLPAATPSASTKKKAGETCVHGGNCESGMCLGVVPGQVYKCSCIDPRNKWEGCRK